MGLEWFHRICPLRTLVFHLTKLFKLWFYSCIRIFCLLVFESTNNNTPQYTMMMMITVPLAAV